MYTAFPSFHFIFTPHASMDYFSLTADKKTLVKAPHARFWTLFLTSQ